MSTASIRKASERDLDALEALHGEVQEFHRQGESAVFKSLTPGASRDHILSFITGSNAVTFVAEVGGRIIGFVQAKTEVSPENPFHRRLERGIINGLGVTAEAKRGRIGSQLLEAAEAWIRERGIYEVLLNVWEFNEAALHFYNARGYATSSRKMTRKLPKP